MADPVTTIQTAAATVDATHALLTAIFSILPTIGYAITAVAAFLPKPDDSAPAFIKLAYKAVTYIAWNVKHAKNVAASESEKEAEPANAN